MPVSKQLPGPGPTWNGEVADLSGLPRIRLALHRYFPLAAGYFFLNAAGLPPGLFFTNLLAPVVYVWLYVKGQRWLTTKFLLLYSPFLIAHMVNGIPSPYYYLRSLILLWSVFITAYGICWSLLQSCTLVKLFDQLIISNFAAAVLAVLSLPTAARSFFWRDDTDTLASRSHLLRLNLLSVEPSAYAFLMLPLLVFALLRFFKKPNSHNFVFAAMIVIPLLLSQSFGGISMSLAAIGVSLIVTYPTAFKRLSSVAALGCCAVVALILITTHNTISSRIIQVATGGDSSTHARTAFSFIAAYAVASSKSLIWGAGLGQTKLFDFSALDIGFEVNVIPNAVAGVFAELGLVGVGAKFAMELYLFFKMKTYRSSFRLACFVVGFIAQLTGGYLVNIEEYILWFFAFQPSWAGTNFDVASKGASSSRLNRA